MNAFIDEHRTRCGVEPICRALQVAPSAYRRHAARQRNPALQPARSQRDASLLPQVQRVYDQNPRVYGADKVWRQLRREGTAVARCTVKRLMRERLAVPRDVTASRRRGSRRPAGRGQAVDFCQRCGCWDGWEAAQARHAGMPMDRAR